MDVDTLILHIISSAALGIALGSYITILTLVSNRLQRLNEMYWELRELLAKKGVS